MQKMKQQQLNLQEMNKEIYLFGASGHGKVVKDLAEDNNYTVKAFIDDLPKKDFINNIPVKSVDEFNNFDSYDFLISIGNNLDRKKISERISNNYVSLIHSSAQLSKTVKIGKGTVIMSGVSVNADSIIGNHVIVNTGAVIEHDCIIDDFVHISPNATVTGGVKIGEGTQVGANAVVLPNINIGTWVTIGAGAVIIEDLPDFSVVVGNPGKVIKFNS